MGAIADQLRARLDQMRTRHAQEDAEIDRLKAEAWEAWERVEATHRAMEDALRTM